MTVERVVVINDMATARGGATALALDLAKGLAQRDIKVTYITGDTGDSDWFDGSDVEMLAAGGAELLKQTKATAMVEGIYNRRAKRLLAEFIETRDTARTIYHVHGWAQTLSPSIFAPLAQVACRTLVHCHDFFMACPNAVFFDFQRSKDCTRKPLGLACAMTNCDKRSYVHKGWRLLRHATLRRVFNQSLPWAGLILIHPGMAQQMVEAGYRKDRLAVIRNPAVAYSKTRIRAERNQDFVFVGRIEPDKGVADLIAAAARAKVALMIIGDGPLRRALAAQHPGVTFTGWKTHAEIGKLVASARALVMPSRFREPFGMVALEASQSGLPVILPRNALLAPEISENNLGLTCDVRDPEEFVARLVEMRDMDSNTLRAMSQRGHSGGAFLASSPLAWVDQQVALYDCALRRLD